MVEPAILFNAIKGGETDRVHELLEKEPELVNKRDQNGLSPVLISLYYNQREITQRILEYDPELNIFEAAAAGVLEKVQELVGQSPELVNAYNADGFQPLGLAAFFGQAQVAEFLLENGADANSASRNAMRVQPLHSAAASGNLEIAKMLLQHGADPNAVQADDFRPLHAAAQNGQGEMIQLLLDHGADPSLEAADGKKALHFAKESGNAEAIALLDRSD